MSAFNSNSTMFKVTNTGVYEKLVIKVKGKCVFYFRTNKIRGRIRQQKELLHTQFHDWFYSEKKALANYNERRAQK